MKRHPESLTPHRHPGRRALTLTLILLPVLWLWGCLSRPLEKPELASHGLCELTQPLFLDKDVDILFVIDNSDSMADEQARLAAQFPRLIEAMRSAKLGNKIPNVRIGVVSSDLGAGNFSVPSCEQGGGDGGRLQSTGRVAGCTPPKDPWISYTDGVTNVPNGAGKDPVDQVKEAFSCIARLGVGGCGFEQPLEAARLALDPAQNRNPNFLRNDPKSGRDALLAVVFITDEDDCSVQNPLLFDPQNAALGPYESFRCFEGGVVCDDCVGAACRTLGEHKNCRAGGKYLRDLDNYVKFFQNLKKTADGKPAYDRVLMAAIAGTTDTVKVVRSAKTGNPALAKQCAVPGKDDSGAVPAIRIRQLVHAFAKPLTAKEVADIKAKKSNTPHWVDDKGVWREENFTSICQSDFAPALAALGKRIVGSLANLCLTKPALTDLGGVLCRKGDLIFDDGKGTRVTCDKSCLDQASFTVLERRGSSEKVLPRCPDTLFDPKIPAAQCGQHCGCWRLVYKEACDKDSAQWGNSPYGVEVMRRSEAPKGTMITVTTACTPASWGTAPLGSMPQCR